MVKHHSNLQFGLFAQDILKGLGPVGGESETPPANEERWVTDVHRRLKYSDASVMTGCQGLLKDYEQDLLVADSVQEFLDVAGMQRPIDFTFSGRLLARDFWRQTFGDRILAIDFGGGCLFSFKGLYTYFSGPMCELECPRVFCWFSFSLTVDLELKTHAHPKHARRLPATCDGRRGRP